MFYQHGPDKEH